MRLPHTTRNGLNAKRRLERYYRYQELQGELKDGEGKNRIKGYKRR